MGLNCALGAADMKPYIANLAECADCYIFAYPNAGLPNAMGGYDQKDHEMAEGAGVIQNNFETCTSCSQVMCQMDDRTEHLLSPSYRCLPGVKYGRTTLSGGCLLV